MKPEHERRDWVVTACCIAAGTVADAALSEREKARVLMDCLGVVAAAYPVGDAPPLGVFRDRLHGPLGDLMPPGVECGALGEVRLLDDFGHLADEAWDVCREHFLPMGAVEQHWRWGRVRAEQEEQRLYQILRRLPAEGYTTARELLVDVPSGELTGLRRAWDRLWGQLDVEGAIYEPIADWPWCQVEGWWFACPVCRWPMRASRQTKVWSVRCEAHAAVGIRYVCDSTQWGKGVPRLTGAGRRAVAVVGQPASPDHLAVSRTVWRYVTLPGVLETELRDYALSKGASVVMWPHHDAYDVHVELRGQVRKLDAKVWASSFSLLEAVVSGRKTIQPDIALVIPDHQKPARSLLREVLKLRGVEVLTAQQVKRWIDNVAKGAAR